MKLATQPAHSWLSRPASEWSSDTNFGIMAKFVRQLQVVNDPAERSVKLIDDFARKITMDENQRQFLLQSVEKNRQEVPVMKKGAFV